MPFASLHVDGIAAVSRGARLPKSGSVARRRRASFGRFWAAVVTVTMTAAFPALFEAPPAVGSTRTISAVGSLASRTGSAVSSLTVDPQNAGDALVAVVKISSGTLSVSSLSGGRVSSWTRLKAVQDGSHDTELWLGTLTSTGSSTLSVTFSGSAGGDDVDLVAQEFTAGLGAGTVWTTDKVGGQANASSTSIKFPSLAAANAGELYFGYARSANTISAGSTPGFTYVFSADANLVTYDTNTSGTAAPQASVSPGSSSTAVAALLQASAGSTPAPTVTSISPTSGPASGGTAVTITGTNLTGASAVNFGTVAGTSVSVVSSTQVAAVSPAGSGTVNVTVTTPGGTAATSSADQFSYVAPPPAPTVTSISPTSGPASGGTAVTITGTNLTGASAVNFGTVAGTSVSVVSSTQVAAVSPAGSGTVNVTVTTPGGTAATSSADQFSYVGSTRTISAVGSLVSASSSGVSSLTVDPQNAGDAIVLLVHIVASTATVSSISGGGSADWTRYEMYEDVPSWSGQPHDTEIWLGTVGTTGPSTISVRYTGSVASMNIDLAAQEFTAGLGASTKWSKDSGAGQENTTPSTNVPFPTLTSSGSSELYFGYAWVPEVALAGSANGVTYDVTADSNVVCFDPSVSGALTPVATQTLTDPSASIGVLIGAS